MWHRLDESSSWVSGRIGKRCGYLISALLPVNAMSALGPALSHSSFRSGKTWPNILRGPFVVRFRSSATQWQTNTGWSHIRFVKGNLCLHSFLPFAKQLFSGFLSSMPLSLNTRGWIWWLLWDSVCCVRWSYLFFPFCSGHDCTIPERCRKACKCRVVYIHRPCFFNFRSVTMHLLKIWIFGTTHIAHVFLEGSFMHVWNMFFNVQWDDSRV